jgi:CRISPR/Cas system-associated protein endoribonuclease Cas2
MEMTEGAKKGRMMNIKENYYIYQFNHFNKLIHEQKHIKQSDNQSLRHRSKISTHTNIYVTEHQAINTATQRMTKQYRYTQRQVTTDHNIQGRSNKIKIS